MKKSELKKEIKDYIYEILSETDLDPKGGSVVMSKQSNPTDIKKYTEKGIDVQLKEEDEDDLLNKALDYVANNGDTTPQELSKHLQISINQAKDLIKSLEVNESEEDVVSFKHPDSRMDKQSIQDALNYLKKALSPEGWESIKKYVKTAGEGGWNRPYFIIRLAYIFGRKKSKSFLGPGTPKEQSLNKTELISYSNKDLLGLIDSGDLVLKGKKYYPYNQINTSDVNESEEDSSPDDETIDKQAKAAAKKEKIQGPSKFKFTNTEFEDFKTKLKNLVIKIKNMEKGAERDKKMAALKQFIKKPELVKAFKERDVKIDTGGLVGESKNNYPFYNTVKRGDKVKYVGPEKNGFKKGETYEVDHVKSSSTLQKTVVLKDGKRKIIVKGTNSIQPLD